MSDHKIEPECLGMLGDRPLAEQARTSSPDDLFPGASQFLNARTQRKRRKQWDAVLPLVGRVLQPGERILYVAYALQAPPFLHTIGLGYMAYAYHQVLLVLTDQRIIETLLNFNATRAATRVRSYPYRHLSGLKLSFSTLTAVPAQGKKQAWKLGIGGDKKMVKLLLPRLQTRLLTEGSAHAGQTPSWHCPRCGTVVPPEPASCAGCRTQFRSTRFATVLSLAFPGAGLFYLGYPFLGVLDLLGESMLFLVWLVLLSGAGETDGIAPAVVAGGIFLAITKIESIHLGRVLGARSIPEPEGRRERLRKLSLAGAVASVLLVAAAFPLTARVRPRLERDLEASTEDGIWSGSRKVADWTFYKDQVTARSQWTHAPTGVRVTVFAHPQSLLEDQEQFHRDYSEGMKDEVTETLADDGRIPPPFRGFRYIGEMRTDAGEQVALVDYFLYDPDGHDIHRVSLLVPREDAEAGEAVIQDFVRHARFIDAVAPER